MSEDTHTVDQAPATGQGALSEPPPVSHRPGSVRGALRPLVYSPVDSDFPPPSSSRDALPPSWAPIEVRAQTSRPEPDQTSSDAEPPSVRARQLPPPPASDPGPISIRSVELRTPASQPVPPSGPPSAPPPSVRGKPVDEIAPASLRGSMARYVRPSGTDLLARTEKFYEWQQTRRKDGLWPYSRALETPMRSRVRMRYDDGQLVEGLNFASQDYLSLSSHPAIHEAAIRALRDFGPHSAGSPCLTGNTQLSLQLERAVGDLMAMEHVVLFQSGWGAGFGVITALVRDYDHVVMDALSHASLQQGAMAATRNVVRFNHLDNEAARRELATIRAKDAKNGILVITETLFSMDSDCPRLAELQAICREHEATLLVDAAHDLGEMGPGGTGQLGFQGMLGKIDLVMGCFSKAFATNGGFLATRSAAVKQFVKYYAGPYTFSTALSPVQAGIALEALRISRSEEGDRLRESLERAVRCLRSELVARGQRCLGEPSAIVPVHVGSERVARLASGMLADRGVMLNLVEYPAVAVGTARFRMQVMAAHTMEQVRIAAEVVNECIRTAAEIPRPVETGRPITGSR